VTITISGELEDKLSRRAAAEGLALEDYAREVLERDVAIMSLRELFAPVREQVAESGLTDEEIDTLLETARERGLSSRVDSRH
jgi:hypothetical protein